MPPLVLLFAGVAGGVALVKMAAREGRRVNRELEEAREQRLDKDRAPKLHRDPQTGAFRPQ